MNDKLATQQKLQSKVLQQMQTTIIRRVFAHARPFVAEILLGNYAKMRQITPKYVE